MAGVAASVASTTLGVAISGTVVGTTLARGGSAFTSGEHTMWWTVLGLGLGIVILGLVTSGRWAHDTAARSAASFQGADTDPTAGPSRGAGVDARENG